MAMEISNRDRRQAPRGVNKKFMMLAALGGLGFWLANFAFSL